MNCQYLNVAQPNANATALYCYHIIRFIYRSILYYTVGISTVIYGHNSMERKFQSIHSDYIF